MNKVQKQLIAATVALVTLTSGCSSGAEEAVAVEVAQTVGATSTTTAAPTTTSGETPGDTVRIEGQVTRDPTMGTGTWEVGEGADLLGCSGGTLTEFEAEGSLASELTCTGTRSGSFVGRFSPAGEGDTFTSSWHIIVTTGDFEGMSGTGLWSIQVDPGGESGAMTIDLDIAFGDVAVPVARVPRLVQPSETECVDGFATEDGLSEYATVDDSMLRLDLETGEITNHGAPPSGCSQWLGDPDLGRRVALSRAGGPMALPNGEHKVWLGPYEGDWDVELTYDEVTLLVSRSMAANRLLLTQPEVGKIILLDATTGDAVGPGLEGSFGDSRHFLAATASPDGRLIVLGGENTTGGSQSGQLFVLDAVTGAELARIEMPAPPTSLAFDADSASLVAALFTGEIVTVDAVNYEVVSNVSLSSPTSIMAIGVRPDGLVVVATNTGAELVDRLTGPTGSSIKINEVGGAARIQPDGRIATLSRIQRYEIYEIPG